MQIDSRQAEGGRNQNGGGFAVGPERLAVDEQHGVELAGTPGVEHGAHGRHIDAEHLRHRLEPRRQRDDRADVEIAIGPAVAAPADAFRERVVDRGVAQRTLDPHRADPPLIVEETRHADDGIELEQLERGRGILQVDLAARDRALE
jgi:hypothetical protein